MLLTDGIDYYATGIRPTHMTQLKTVEDCIPYAGWPNHSLYDAKSLALHSRIARHISKDPGLLNKARKNLRRRRDNYDPDALPPFIVKLGANSWRSRRRSLRHSWLPSPTTPCASGISHRLPGS